LRLFLGLTHDRRNRLKLFAVANVPAQIILESIEPKQISFVFTHFFSGYSQKLFAADSAQIVAEIIFEKASKVSAMSPNGSEKTKLRRRGAPLALSAGF
jgi:hypothetical protein